MFVQYSFITKNDRPNFKSEPIHFGSTEIVVMGIMAMILTTVAYIVFG